MKIKYLLFFVVFIFLYIKNSYSQWSSVSCGSGHTIAIKTDGTIWAWGNNYNGQLGLGDYTNRNIPTMVNIINQLPTQKLENAYAYPVPFSPGFENLYFANITPECTIEIYTISGIRVKRIYADINAYAFWNGKDENGEIIGTGTYIVHIKDKNNNKKTFKIMALKQ